VYVEAGTKIRVKEVQGVRIVVVPVKDIEPPKKDETGDVTDNS
jgi:hypothetical protein